MTKTFAFILVFALTGCSTMQYTANPQGNSYSNSDVQVLYDYPSTQFKSLGVIDFDYYQPGFREPTVTDALPKLKDKVREVGGNALIVRNQRIGQFNNRYITVSTEVLLIEGGDGTAGQHP